MASIPRGATKYVEIQLNPTITVYDWMALVCITDVDAGINTTYGQNFVAQLSSDLSDLEITDDEFNPLPWRRVKFDQTPNHEALYIFVNIDTLAPGDTIYAFCGCTSPVGENSGADVVSSHHLLYFPGKISGGKWENWAGNDLTLSYGTESANGILAECAESDNPDKKLCDDTGIGLDYTLSSTGYTMIMWGNGIDFGGVGGHWGIYGQENSTRIRINVGETFANGPLVSDGVWTMIAAVFNPSVGQATWYKNSGLSNTVSISTVATPTVPVVVGGDAFTIYHGLNGCQDETHIISGMWSSYEIHEYYGMITDIGNWSVVVAEHIPEPKHGISVIFSAWDVTKNEPVTSCPEYTRINTKIIADDVTITPANPPEPIDLPTGVWRQFVEVTEYTVASEYADEIVVMGNYEIYNTTIGEYQTAPGVAVIPVSVPIGAMLYDAVDAILDSILIDDELFDTDTIGDAILSALSEYIMTAELSNRTVRFVHDSGVSIYISNFNGDKRDKLTRH